MTLVSVIIPTYNNSATIEMAVESVLQQSLCDVEILIIDDGSTDDTARKIKSLQEKNGQKIHYFFQENAGPAAARNKGLNVCQGEFIAFLDADDEWMPEKLAKQVAVLNENTGCGFVYCDNIFVNTDGRPIENYVREIKKVRGDILLDLFKNHLLMTPAVMFRQSCLQKTSLFKEYLRVGEDYDFFLRLAKNFKADYIDEKLWKRFVDPHSLSRQDYVQDAVNDLSTLHCFIKESPDFYQKNRIQIKQRLADYHFSFGYRLLEDGNNFLAFMQLSRSFFMKPSILTMKNIALCMIPFSIRNKLKGRYAKS